MSASVSTRCVPLGSLVAYGELGVALKCLLSQKAFFDGRGISGLRMIPTSIPCDHAVGDDQSQIEMSDRLRLVLGKYFDASIAEVEGLMRKIEVEVGDE